MGLTSPRSFKLADTKNLLRYAIVSSLAVEFLSSGGGVRGGDGLFFDQPALVMLASKNVY